MPIDLSTYLLQTGERSNANKMDGLINTVQGALRAVGDQSKGGWGSGTIVLPSQLKSGGATVGSLIPGPYSTTVLSDSPRGYWKLDEASGNFTDSSGNAHTGTANGAITYSAAGAFNTGITLNGANSYISVPDHADFDLGDVLTLEAWVKPTNFNSFPNIFDKGNTAYRMNLGPTGKIRLEKPGTGVIVASALSVPLDGAWHHVVVTKNGATVKQYLDAVDVTGTVANQTLGDNAIQMGIGAQLDGAPPTNFFTGGLDEVAVYPTALSAARVLAHFNARGTLAAPQTLIWNGTAWTPTATTPRSTVTATSTIDIVNDAAQKDLFTGNAATAANAGLTLPVMQAGSVATITAAGDYLNNSGGGKHLNLFLGLTSGGVFTPIWGDDSTGVGANAARRAWRLKASFMYNGSSHDQASGLFALTGTTAPITGLGALKAPSGFEHYAPFTATDPAVDPNGRRLVLALTHPVADPNLSMRLLFGRVEVTL